MTTRTDWLQFRNILLEDPNGDLYKDQFNDLGVKSFADLILCDRQDLKDTGFPPAIARAIEITAAYAESHDNGDISALPDRDTWI